MSSDEINQLCDVAQLLGYLRGSGKRYGLLINFGAPKLFIKRYVLDPVV